MKRSDVCLDSPCKLNAVIKGGRVTRARTGQQNQCSTETRNYSLKQPLAQYMNSRWRNSWKTLRILAEALLNKFIVTLPELMARGLVLCRPAWGLWSSGTVFGLVRNGLCYWLTG